MAQEELEVTAGPTGVTGKFKGAQTLEILMAILLGAWVWYLTYNTEAKASERERLQIIATEKLVDAVREQTKTIQKQEETQQAIIWVLSRPQNERERLGLAKPRIIFEMQR